MAYSADICKTLTDQVTKFSSLNRHQLVGHLANLDFWVAEVRHSLEVIDGYGDRFEQMKAAQKNFVADHATVQFRLSDPRHTQAAAAPPRRVPSEELGEARRQLCDALYRFLVRCLQEGLLDERTVRGVCGSLDIGVESSDLRRRP